MSAREVARFFAWCSDTDTVDTFAAIVSALHSPGRPCRFHQYTTGTREEIYRSELSADEVIALVRATFTNNS